MKWAENIRELQNVLEYAFVVGQGTVLQLSELPPEFREPIIKHDQTDFVITTPHESEKSKLERALNQCDGKITQAATLLGMSRATFWRKRKQYGF